MTRGKGGREGGGGRPRGVRGERAHSVALLRRGIDETGEALKCDAALDQLFLRRLGVWQVAHDQQQPRGARRVQQRVPQRRPHGFAASRRAVLELEPACDGTREPLRLVPVVGVHFHRRRLHTDRPSQVVGAGCARRREEPRPWGDEVCHTGRVGRGCEDGGLPAMSAAGRCQLVRPDSLFSGGRLFPTHRVPRAAAVREGTGAGGASGP